MKNKPYFNEDIFLYLLYKKSKKKYYQYLKNGKKIKRITKKGTGEYEHNTIRKRNNQSH